MAKKDIELVVIERKIDPNAWMVTFSDLLTLLLTFFVLLLTMSSMDQKKLKESFGALESSFQTTSASGSAVIQNERPVPITSEQTVGISNENTNTTTEAYRELMRLLEQMQGQDIITFEIHEDQVVIRFKNTMTFERGSHDLTEESAEAIRVLAPLLIRMDYPMLVEGHVAQAARVDARDPSAQMALSLHRAHSVMRALEMSLGNDPSVRERFTMVGRGAQSPLAGDIGPGDPRHQRVEIIIQTGLSL